MFCSNMADVVSAFAAILTVAQLAETFQLVNNNEQRIPFYVTVFSQLLIIFISLVNKNELSDKINFTMLKS